MKKFLSITGIILLFSILDNSLMPFLAIKGCFGSLLFIFAISYSIMMGSVEAVIIGVIAGILQDIFLFNGFGVNCLLNMILCIVASIVGKNTFKEKSIIGIFTCFVLSLIKGISISVIFMLLHKGIDINKIVITAIYDMVISLIMYNRIVKFTEKSYVKKEWKF